MCTRATSRLRVNGRYPHPASAISIPVCGAPVSGHAVDRWPQRRFVPRTALSGVQKRTGLAGLLDYLVGANEQRLRDSDSERFGSLHVDYQLELGRLLYW